MTINHIVLYITGVVLFLASSCESAKKSEAMIAAQDKLLLTVMLIDYRDGHDLEFPSDMDDLLNGGYAELNNEEVSRLKKNWLYSFPPDKEASSMESNYVVLETTTSKGQIIRVRIKDLVKQTHNQRTDK